MELAERVETATQGARGLILLQETTLPAAEEEALVPRVEKAALACREEQVAMASRVPLREKRFITAVAVAEANQPAAEPQAREVWAAADVAASLQARP